MTIQELKAQRVALLNRRKELHDLAITEAREFTEIEQTEFDKAGDDAGKLVATIEREEVVAAEQAEVNAPVRLSQPMRPDNGSQLTDVRNRLTDDPTGGFGTPGDFSDIERLSTRQRATLLRGFSGFALDVARVSSGISDRLGRWDIASRELAAGDGMTTGIGSEGGYLIPIQFASLLDNIALEAAVVRPRATLIPMTSPRLSFQIIDDQSHASTVFGGIVAFFKSEEAQLTASKPKFASVELDLHKLTVLCHVSGEMLDWSPLSLDSWLPNKMGQALAWKEDEKFIGGNGGSGEPIGLLNATAILEISKETEQEAATLVFENIIKMDARLWAPAGRGRVGWIANRTLKTQLPKLGYIEGVSSVPIFLPADGAAGRPLETLYGYPIIFTEKAQALGTAGDIMLVNFEEYLIGDASGKTRAARDMGLKFDYDQVSYRLVPYTGGMCPWRSAFQPKNGDTLSPIVSLETRS